MGSEITFDSFIQAYTGGYMLRKFVNEDGIEFILVLDECPEIFRGKTLEEALSNALAYYVQAEEDKGTDQAQTGQATGDQNVGAQTAQQTTADQSAGTQGGETQTQTQQQAAPVGGGIISKIVNGICEYHGTPAEQCDHEFNK